MTDITLQQVNHDLGFLHRQTVALEGFQRWVVGHDEITGPAARVIRIALEDSEKEESKGVTGKDIVTGVKKVAVTIRNIVQWLLRMIGKIVEKIGAAMQRLGEKGQKVKARAKSLGSEEATKMESTPVDGSKFNAAALSVGAEFVGNNLEQMKHAITLSEWMVEVLLPGIIKVVQGIPNLTTKHMTDESPDDFMEELGNMIRMSIRVPKMRVTETDFTEGFDGDPEKMIKSVPLPGNVGFIMTNPNGIADVFGSLDAIRSGFHFAVVPYSGAQELDASEFKAPSAQQLGQIVDMINGCSDKWNDKATVIARDFERALGSIEETSGKFIESEQAATAHIGNAIATVLQRFGVIVKEGVKWSNTLFTNELDYLSACLDLSSPQSGDNE